MNLVSVILLVVIAPPLFYLYLLALASLRHHSTGISQQPRHRFAITIPAHDEEGVIGSTVLKLHQMHYPSNLFDIHVVADHCTDLTAQVARAAGAVVHERTLEPRSSKAAALNWLGQCLFILDPESQMHDRYDALVIFDADTSVDPDFLRVMDARLTKGDRVIQGQHRIKNPNDGWFPALVSAMFIIDNRFQNLGRSNLGWSAKHMGDSICFCWDVIKSLGAGEGLTEDYECRQRLLLRGIRITYEPAAMGYGEAPANWAIARAQRTRWLSGTFNASRRCAGTMLREGLRRTDFALLDGAAQAYLPSYSTLTLASVAILVGHLLCSMLVSRELIYAWGVVVVSLTIYPLIGLVLEGAPWRAFVAMSLGPIFIVWRTGLSIVARCGQPVRWVRTERRGNILNNPRSKQNA